MNTRQTVDPDPAIRANDRSRMIGLEVRVGRYYDNEDVIGSYSKYHRPSCPNVRRIESKNQKRLRSWAEAVQLGLEPCGVCRPFHGKTPSAPLTASAVDKSVESIATATELSNWRRGVVQLVKKVDTEPSRADEGIAARIGRLTRNGMIPREVAAVMRTITEMRNASEYESKALSSAQSTAVRSAWEVVKEWADSRGIAVP